jgi:hypothetical protein
MCPMKKGFRIKKLKPFLNLLPLLLKVATAFLPIGRNNFFMIKYNDASPDGF